jgi:alpha-aminoadipate carrier protein LysW
MGTCPQCGTTIDTPEAQLGEIVACPGCGADLEVISEDPLTVEVYEQEEK